MQIPEIEKKSIIHSLIRPLIDFFHDWIFNQRVFKINKDKLPKSGPAIVVFTHQCALMDSLAVMSLAHWQPIHIARADIFKPKIQRKLLFLFKIMPVFRIRDGIRNVKETYETFDKASEVLAKKQFVIIAPEANHVPQRRLRTLSKGFARMAFKAEEDNNFSLKLKIIPIGLHYEDYYSARISVAVNVGEPIIFDDLLPIYKKDKQKAYLLLKNRVAEAMKKLIIHIEDKNNYDNCETIRYAGMHALARKKNMKITNEKNRFLIGKELIEIIRNKVKKQNPQLFSKLMKYAEDYRTEINKSNIPDFIVRKNTPLLFLIVKTFWYLLSFPLFLWGFLSNAIIYYLPKYMTRKMKDESFHTSVRFVHYMVLYPLYYIALFFISGFFLENVLYRAILILSLPLSGIFSISYARGIKKLFFKFKFLFSSEKNKIINKRNRLLSTIKEALSYY